MNKLYFKALGKYMMTVIVALAFGLSGCETNDDRSDCTADMTFRFEYTLNSSRSDLFTENAERADIFIYDSGGAFYTVVRTSRNDGTLKTDNRVTVSLPHGNYTAVAWANMNGEYKCDYESYINNNKVSLITNGGYVDNPPTKLMHAIRDITVSNSMSGKDVILSMTKNRKKISVVLKVTGNKTPVTADDFDVSVSIRNGVYKFDNSLAACEPLQYTGSPSLPEYAVYQADFYTLRLLQGEQSLLKIARGMTTRRDIPLPSEISLIDEIMRHPSYGTQEDLDREDEFRLVYTVNISKDQTYVVTLIKINDWDVVGQGGSVE